MSELYLIVRIGGEHAAISATSVESVIELERVTPVQQVARHVVGVSALRSRPLTIVDCSRSLGLPDSGEPADGRRGVVVAVDGHLFALAVDDVQDVVEVDEEPEEVPVTLGPQWDRVAIGMIETDLGAMLVIDPRSIIDGPPIERAA